MKRYGEHSEYEFSLFHRTPILEEVSDNELREMLFRERNNFDEQDKMGNKFAVEANKLLESKEDPERLNNLILALLYILCPLIGHIANEDRQIGNSYFYDDLKQISVLTLYKILSKYNPEKGNFKNFFINCLKHDLIDLKKKVYRRSIISLDGTDRWSNDQPDRDLHDILTERRNKRRKVTEERVLVKMHVEQFIRQFVGDEFLMLKEGYTIAEISAILKEPRAKILKRLLWGKDNFAVLYFLQNNVDLSKTCRALGIAYPMMRKRLERAREVFESQDVTVEQ